MSGKSVDPASTGSSSNSVARPPDSMRICFEDKQTRVRPNEHFYSDDVSPFLFQLLLFVIVVTFWHVTEAKAAVRFGAYTRLSCDEELFRLILPQQISVISPLPPQREEEEPPLLSLSFYRHAVERSRPWPSDTMWHAFRRARLLFLLPPPMLHNNNNRQKEYKGRRLQRKKKTKNISFVSHQKPVECHQIKFDFFFLAKKR